VKRAVLSLIVLAVVARSGAATGRERLGVLISVDGDRLLADNLTEVAIARLAEKRRYELVGARELERRLSQAGHREDWGTCLARPACVSRVCAIAEMQRAVVGSVRRIHDTRLEGDTFHLELALVRADDTERRSEIARDVPAAVPRLIAAVQDGLDELFSPSAAVAPVPSATPVPIRSPAAEQSQTLHSLPPRPGAGTSPAAYLGYGAGALAAVAFSAAVVTGSLAEAAPMGSTRAEMQQDLERRNDFAAAANGLYVAGALLSTAAIATLVWYVRGH
jgi:hypothetical protein